MGKHRVPEAHAVKTLHLAFRFGKYCSSMNPSTARVNKALSLTQLPPIKTCYGFLASSGHFFTARHKGSATWTDIAELGFASLNFYRWLPSKNKLLIGFCMNARPHETSSVTFRLCFDGLLFHQLKILWAMKDIK